ncbi:MAG: sugar ABC transporter permease [Bacillota bacterium]|nr:sugar ABC transporter permease [Bacillota bacterium]
MTYRRLVTRTAASRDEGQGETRGRRSPRLSLRTQEAIWGWVLAMPIILGMLLWTLGPMVASAILSFMKWDLLTPPKWVGVANYVKMFTGDRLFWQAVKVTTLYALFRVPLGLAFGLLIALLMNQKLPGIYAFRTIYYLPSVLSGVAVALLWMWIFAPDFGLLNVVLWKVFHIKGPSWLFSETWALPAMVIMSLWGVGGGMLICLAGLQGIPTELYEAAEIDGAGPFAKLTRITLPLMSPVLFFNLVQGIISALRVFTEAYVMTGGGPNYATYFYGLHIYTTAFADFKMGYASALAWFLFLYILALTLLVFKSSPAWVYYEGRPRA